MFRTHYNTIIYFSLLLVGMICSSESYATHNRAGEITYVQTGNLTIVATVTTYTKESSVPADRDSLMVCWGDMNCEWVLRSNGEGESLGNDTKRNHYTATHSYSAFGHYTISMNDPNRNEGILNVNNTQSENVPFHLQTTVTFFNPQIEGPNSSPVLLQPPVDIGCTCQPFIHNPNAFDPDGDSLSYHLIVPLQDINTPVPDYSFPNEINPNPNNPNCDNFLNAIDLNEFTGDFVWHFPQVAGEYNIAMIIVEHRDGVAVDTLIRDMQILIEACDNIPPEIETIDEICVVAGEFLEFEVIATAPLSETDQMVALTALGAPFSEVEVSPATFIVDSGFQPQPLIGVFKWQTTCEHISDQAYSVVFRAEDDFPIPVTNDGQTDILHLSTLKTVLIKVVGPPPLDVQAEPSTEEVEVTWENPYSCENADDEYFKGFSVWRKEGSNVFPIDCEPGLEGRGYTKISSPNTEEIVDGRYYYLDTDVERGRTYCYRILAEFAKTSAGGLFYNWVESLPSEEFCVQLSRDIPLITNVDIEETDFNTGKINIAWSKPIAEDLDTILNEGPYVYELERSTGITTTGFQSIAVFSSDTFFEANDTTFQDQTLNTVDNAYTYRVAFYVNDDFANNLEPLGYTNPASSVFLSIASTDEINNLSWEEMVPWSNTKYDIYRKNSSSTWDSIGTSSTQNYSDTGLLNGVEYCYRVKSIGSYGIEGVINPILNFSQEDCGIPLDTIPPCPPLLEVFNICDEIGNGSNCLEPDILMNDLQWDNPINLCAHTDDVVRYYIYYAEREGEELELIDSIGNSLDTTYTHFPDLGLAGCYAVTALDTFYNESAFSNIVCVDNCPLYELPNVFTPNGDGANDLFIPFPFCFIDRIDLNIFNRWGQLVYQTTDPNINWNGQNLKGQDLAEGVYYYTCKVFEQRVNGIVENSEILSGYIELLGRK